MKFESVTKETVLFDPRENMKERRIPSEIRRDPLTGRSARICHFMKLQWEKPDFAALVAGTEAWCPFCPTKVMEVTPMFPPEMVPEGRMIADDCVLFPNLAPYDSVGAVATLGARHFVPMAEITPEFIRKGFELAMRFFRRIEAIGHSESVYHLINWNYMPAAGSSLIHPHLQVFVSSQAPNLLQEELNAARAYRETTQRNYWEDLVAHETISGERYLGKIGRTHWLTAYAPMGVAGDVLAITDEITSTVELTDRDLVDIANGLTRAMRAYDEMGIYNFNMNFFSGARGDGFTRFHLLFSPRTFFNQALGASDVGAIRNLYNETLCMAFPEEINTMLKPAFQDLSQP
jgi:galactose-1-phosphate uridylyltransferase